LKNGNRRGYLQVSLDEQQAPDWELDALLLARSNQEPRVSGEAPTASNA